MGANSPTFDWDEANAGHVGAHGVSSSEVEEVIADDSGIVLEVAARNAEMRHRVIGSTQTGRILIVVFTARFDRIRPITAYDAARKPRELYLKGVRP